MPLRSPSVATSRQSMRSRLRRSWWTLLVLPLLAGYWLLPIRGNVLILTNPEPRYVGTWPQMRADPPAARPGDQMTLYVRDNVPWSYVKVLVDGVEVARDEAFAAGDGPWTWRWQLAMPDQTGAVATFYRDCHTGCVERARITLDGLTPPVMPILRSAPVPTKLGVVFADASRDWHGRSAWTVELTYAQRPNDPDFGVDGLARRVQQATRRGLRMLVRIAYDQRQSLPPTGDELALARYLDYSARLARDERLRDVYGYFVGSGYNTLGENTLTPDRPTTPEWYARVFNGYSLPAARGDNVVQSMQAVNPELRILVGPVTPWNSDQQGSVRDPSDQPWLNYFNTVIARLDTSVKEKSKAGIPLAAPNGFALQAPGRPEASDQPAQEPATDLHRPEWNDAQAGFRVYRDWLAIINRHATTRGLPAYITSTNTWTNDTQVPPAQNYPAGWLTTAFAEVNREPQIQALCWFVDAPLGEMWSEFSLSRRMGRLHDAASEFDQLLQE